MFRAFQRNRKRKHSHPTGISKKVVGDLKETCHTAGMKNQQVPTTSKFTVLRQLCNYIPPHLVPQVARDTGVDEQARTFSPWSHVVSLAYAQLTHSIGLNDVCDALQLNSGPLSALRGATPPSRNNLSHANKVRDAAMAEQLFWAELEHLGELSPGFVSCKAS